MFELQVSDAYYSWRLSPPRQLDDEFFIVKHARRLCGTPVDTVFGHVSLGMHLELMKRGSADWAMVASLQGSYR